jgi:hypothetical protein
MVLSHSNTAHINGPTTLIPGAKNSIINVPITITAVGSNDKAQLNAQLSPAQQMTETIIIPQPSKPTATIVYTENADDDIAEPEEDDDDNEVEEIINQNITIEEENNNNNNEDEEDEGPFHGFDPKA